MRIIRCVRRNTGHFYYDDYIKTDFYVTSIVLPDRSPRISKILPLPLLLMKPARSLMDLYRTETYHKINIKYKFKTKSSNAFSMCVRSIYILNSHRRSFSRVRSPSQTNRSKYFPFQCFMLKNSELR